MLTELEKWQLVNQAKTTDLLEEAIRQCDDGSKFILSSHKDNHASYISQQVEFVKGVVQRKVNPAVLTQQYGIRQQALYLIHYNKP